MAKRARKTYTAKQRAEILSAATKENLTAPNGGMPLNTSGGNLAECYMHGLELTDAAPRGTCHPGNEVVPPALAYAEKLNRSGAEVLAAVVARGRMALLLPVALVVAVVVRRMEIHLETEELIRAAVVVERSTLPAVLAVLV